MDLIIVLIIVLCSIIYLVYKGYRIATKRSAACSCGLRQTSCHGSCSMCPVAGESKKASVDADKP